MVLEIVRKMCRSFFVLCTLCCTHALTSCDTPVTIFIHGSHNSSKLFIKYTNRINKIVHIQDIPRSCITYSFAQSLSQADPDQFPQKYFYVFGWSGKLNNRARRDAAKILYREIRHLIKKLEKDGITPCITLITHSHGGNVALNLARVLSDKTPPFYIHKLVLLACPVQEYTRKLINHELFENIYNIYSPLDITQIMDPQGIQPENKNKKAAFFSQRTFTCCPKIKQAKISINKRGITHLGFLLSKFSRRLPTILHLMKQLRSDCIGFVAL